MINRKEFIRAVLAFEKEHGTLEDCFNEENPKRRDLIALFLSDPLIHEYLARTEKEVTFSDGHPVLSDSDDRDGYVHSDYYELRIYKLLPDVIAYRNQAITTSEFFNQGSADDKFFENAIKHLADGKPGISSERPVDMYTISSMCKTFDMQAKVLSKLPRRASPIRIYPNWMDEHASTVVSISDPNNGHLLAVLFMNCNTYEIHDKAARDSFKKALSANSKSIFNIYHDEFKDYLQQQFPLDLSEFTPEESTVLVNNDEGAALRVNSSKELKRDDVDTVYSVDTANANIMVRYTRDIPFVTASHPVQKDNSDCALFSYNFINGIINLLSPEKVEQVIRLARDIANPESEKALKELFTGELKAYLPMYYENGEPCAAERMNDFHLRQRWALGSLSLDLGYPASKPAASPTITQNANAFLSTPADKKPHEHPAEPSPAEPGMKKP